jgi:hypothetical protein
MYASKGPNPALKNVQSSSFSQLGFVHDFGEKRDLLVRKVFPALRARLKEKFVELVDVDLRWGITVEEAERGEVLPVIVP